MRLDVDFTLYTPVVFEHFGEVHYLISENEERRAAQILIQVNQLSHPKHVSYLMRALAKHLKCSVIHFTHMQLGPFEVDTATTEQSSEPTEENNVKAFFAIAFAMVLDSQDK